MKIPRIFVSLFDKAVFLCLTIYFVSKVATSCTKLFADKIGVAETSHDGDEIVFPSVSICAKGKSSVQEFTNMSKNGSPIAPAKHMSEVLVSMEHIDNKKNLR
jgi:hypothetical protein